MSWLLFACAFLALAGGARAADLEYSPDVTRWQEIPVPPDGENADRVVWHYAANYSKISWRVSLENSQPAAQLIDHRAGVAPDPAPFAAKAGRFSKVREFKKVDDGWLVGFNHGEFGAALYWFDPEGKRRYKISNHQIVAFLSLFDDIYALEGLEHMASCGSLIRITRPTASARWQASRVVRLPYAPRTAVVRRDGSMLIVLTDSLVSVRPDHQLTTLIEDAPWASLGASSSILLPDESHLYIGMGQFVGEVDLATNRVRLLAPSAKFLHKLPDDVEKRLRVQYAKGMSKWEQPADLCERMEKNR